jgi:hypothetical protein
MRHNSGFFEKEEAGAPFGFPSLGGRGKRGGGK